MQSYIFWLGFSLFFNLQKTRNFEADNVSISRDFFCVLQSSKLVNSKLTTFQFSVFCLSSENSSIQTQSWQRLILRDFFLISDNVLGAHSKTKPITQIFPVYSFSGFCNWNRQFKADNFRLLWDALKPISKDRFLCFLIL